MPGWCRTRRRSVAGGARSENILKCQLKAINYADYTGVTFEAGPLPAPPVSAPI